MRTVTAYIQVDADTGLYYGSVPGIPGAYTQAETLDKLQHNLKEVLELCLEEASQRFMELPIFIGTLQIDIAVQDS